MSWFMPPVGRVLTQSSGGQSSKGAGRFWSKIWFAAGHSGVELNLFAA